MTYRHAFSLGFLVMACALTTWSCGPRPGSEIPESRKPEPAPAPEVSPLRLAPRETASVVHVDVSKLGGLQGAQGVVESFLFGSEVALTSRIDGACELPATRWLKTLTVFRSAQGGELTILDTSRENGAGHTDCWTHSSEGWSPADVHGRYAFVRSGETELVLVPIGKRILVGSKLEVEQALRTLLNPAVGEPPHPLRVDLADGGIAAAHMRGRFVEPGATEAWQSMRIDDKWVHADTSVLFESAERSAAWMADRKRDTRADVASSTGRAIEHARAEEVLNLPRASGTTKRLLWALHSLLRSGQVSYLASSRPCEPVLVGSVDVHARRVLSIRAAEARSCYEELLSRDPSAQGKVMVDLLLSPDGSVCDPLVTQRSIDDDAFSRCIEMVFRDCSVPKQSSATAHVQVPLSFEPRKKEAK